MRRWRPRGSATIARYKASCSSRPRRATRRRSSRPARCAATTCAASAPGPFGRSRRRGGARAQARRSQRAPRPATGRCSSSSSSSGRSKDDWIARLRATGVRIVSTWPRTPSSSTPRAHAREALRELRGRARLRCAARSCSRARTSSRPRSDASAGCASRSRRSPATTARAARATGRAARATPTAPDSRRRPVHDAARRSTPGGSTSSTADPGVVAVEPEPTPRLLDERQGLILANGDLAPGPGSRLPRRLRRAALRPSETPSTLPFVVDLADRAIGNGTTTPTTTTCARTGPRAGSSGWPTCTSSAARRRTPPPPGLRRARDDQREHRRRLQRRLGREHQGRRGLPLRARRRAARRLGGTTLFQCDGDFDDGGKSFSQIAEDAYLADGPGYSGARIMNNSWGAAGGRRLRRDSAGVRCDRA